MKLTHLKNNSANPFIERCQVLIRLQGSYSNGGHMLKESSDVLHGTDSAKCRLLVAQEFVHSDTCPCFKS